MSKNPDLMNPRYLDEVGWFLYHEKYRREQYGGSYEEERLTNSRLILEEVLKFCGNDLSWLHDKTVVSIGGGCTCELAAWPAKIKMSIDPLINIYNKLEMLVKDVDNTNQTIYLSLSAEDIPFLDSSVDLVLCRNALDHMIHPQNALTEIARILKEDGKFFLDVDIGGSPTPDEPSVFSVESLAALLRDRFEILTETDNNPPHSGSRDFSVRILARKKYYPNPFVNKEKVLQSYLARMERKA
jgi:SAM-dependent methyltransferase